MKENNHTRSFIKEALSKRKVNRQLRELREVETLPGTGRLKYEGKEYLNFCSNDYLGLSRHPKIIERSAAFVHEYGAGSSSSRLITGNISIHEKLERKLATAFNTEAALLFNSGFQANTTILPAVADRNSLILADRNVHNSILQGAILSRASLKRYNHNDLDHLEQLLKEAGKDTYNRIWVVTETIFSMDGDACDLEKIIKLTGKYDALLYSDDAHAIGVQGERGLGLNYNKPGIAISLGTFGKAFGAFGAFVACTREMREYLINYCTGFIYTTAVPPAMLGALDAAIELIPAMEAERKALLHNIQYLKNELNNIGFETGTSDSQIVPVIIGDEQETLELSGHLEDHGIWAVAIRPPTVPKGASRIRLTVTSDHQMEDINLLIRAFKEWSK